MSFAASAGVCFTTGGGEVTRVSGLPTFTGLDETERRLLSAWLKQAGARGIDAAMDLSVRPWGIAGIGAIIGVFDTGRDRASWLIVRHASGWTLARCSDGFVSDVMTSLPAALALIEADRPGQKPPGM